ncbi:hypothetical protein [Neglectibacter timonensis]|jgi:hypothetical protein|uniref:hypothetical protein n=1 Tax=Neglectibacter timonensis TaxID=1776382 RepID=UPI00248D9F9E|nr:hypothetical protein [Neglectibacter timonensis]
MSDYISREAASVVIEGEQKKLCPAGLWGRKFAADADEYDMLQEMLDKLEAIPAADVEPVRHGEWRLVRRMAACGEYECSVCGRIETFGCFNKPENNPYCHCGAKMELEDDHEN